MHQWRVDAKIFEVCTDGALTLKYLNYSMHQCCVEAKIFELCTDVALTLKLPQLLH